MKKTYPLFAFLAFLVPFSSVFCQQKESPAGVTSPKIWLQSKKVNDNFFLENQTTHNCKQSKSIQKGSLFNFNPSVFFDGSKDTISITLEPESGKKLTFFMVYKVTDSIKEQFLWNSAVGQKNAEVLTNKRLADIKSYSYQSFKEKIVPKKASIHFYQHSKSAPLDGAYVLYIGSKPNGEHLPPSALNGSIAEIIGYDRVLSALESQKISSYLAIKYGISLSQLDVKNYINSKGQIIWDADQHKGFDQNITAVGSDWDSNLQQPKSSNAQQEGLITMELLTTAAKLSDNYFVFWSDNGKNLQAKKQQEGEPIGLNREWQLDFSKKDKLQLNWIFDPNRIKTRFPQDRFYWLWVDYSGKGSFEESQSEYLRLQETDRNEKIKLTDFDWDKQKTGRIFYKIQVAPAMFGKAWIDLPSCDAPNSGVLHYSIHGGVAPYIVELKETASNKIIKQWSQTAKNTGTKIYLSSGNYHYSIRDAKGNQYSDFLFITDQDGTQPNLQPNYVLDPEKPLVLDASAGLPPGDYKFEWFYENILMDTNPKITATQAGNYELRLYNGHCKTATKIAVDATKKSKQDGVSYALYPNPTTDGHFSVWMRFPAPTAVTASIHTIAGALVKQTVFEVAEQYNYSDYLATAGFYLVTLHSDFETKTFKLIVK